MRKALPFTLAWFLIAAVVVLAALEAGLRVSARLRLRNVEHFVILQFGPLRPSAVPGLYIELDPARSTPDVPIDAFGFRGGPIDQAKAPDEFRVALVGDSVVYGIALREPQTIGAVVQATLAAEQRGGRLPPTPRISVLNAGVPSYNAAQELAVIDRRLPPFAPDVIVEVLTANDFEGNGFVRFGNPVSRFLYAHARVYRAWIGASRLLFGAPTDSGFQAWRDRNTTAMNEMFRRGREHPDRWLFVLHPILAERPPTVYAKAYKAIRRMMEESGAPFLETGPILRQRFGSLDGLSASATDVIHPNARTAEVIGQAIAEELIRRILISRLAAASPATGAAQ